MSRIINLIALSLLTISLQVEAKDFGKVGQSFEITEEGFIAMIKRKLAQVDMEREKEKMLEVARDRVNNPVAVGGITIASKTREFYYDPGYELKEDLLIPGGQILHKAGTRVNPLDHMNLDRRMIFIDGRDEKQIDWLETELARLKEENAQRAVEAAKTGSIATEIINRVILTGGKIMELQKKLGIELYFDQAGELTDKFGIRAVPAVALQEGSKIKIREIALDEKGNQQ